jgi:hypothetical protein
VSILNIKPNIGILNALIRITIGLTLLSWCTAKLVKQPRRDSYIFIALCGAMKVAEGIVRYCPVTDVVKKYPIMTEESSSTSGSSEKVDLDVDLPYNPT